MYKYMNVSTNKDDESMDGFLILLSIFSYLSKQRPGKITAGEQNW